MLDRGVTRTRTLVVAALLCLAMTAPAARANDVFPTSWGGISFSESDRDLQAAADAPGLAVDPNGTMVATLGLAGGRTFAYRFDPSGHQTARFKIPNGASAIAVDPSANVFVGSASGTVTRYGPAGAQLGSFSAGGPLAALAVDGAANLYVASGATVKRFSAGGAPGGSFGAPGDIGKAAAVAVDAAGHVFVADSTAKRVEEFDPSGALVRTFGSPIANPTDVGVDGAGGVYVADAGGQGFDVRKFAADGTYLGVVDSGFFNADSRPFEPVLLAVAPQGDVYFTPFNPDIAKIPAPIVPAPRFRVIDDSRGDFDNDLTPLAVSVGRTYSLTARIFPSLSHGLRASVSLAAGLQLAPGASATQSADIPAGMPTFDLRWPVVITGVGRQLATITATGTDGSGNPTSFVKRLPIYGVAGPHLKVVGALLLPHARELMVAVQMTVGSFAIPASERFELQDYFGNLNVNVRARLGGRGLGEEPISFGGPLEGMCQPFFLRRGQAVRGKVKVVTTFAADARLAAAHAVRTIKPVVHTRNKILRACVETSGLAGGPTS